MGMIWKNVLVVEEEKMVALTPEMAGNTMVFTLVYGIFAFVITIYTLVLNWKQTKVREQMHQ